MTAAGMPRTPSTNAAVHRDLIVTDPPMLGADVKALKTELRARLKARGLDDDVRIGTHDKFTHATWLACVEVGYALGLASSTYLKTDKGRGVCTQGAQRIYRDPATRTNLQFQRAKVRQERVQEGPRYLDELTKDAAPGKGGTGADAAVAYLSRYVGIHERPAGSNSDRGNGRFGSGPVIDKWIKAAGYNGPVPWCGCGANAGIMAGGLPSGAGWIGYVPAIVEHARRGIGGWKLIDAANGRRGDLACFISGGEYVHVETAKERVNATTYRCIGCNTGGTNPADGGMVADTTRHTMGSFRIGCFARPPYEGQR